MKCLRCGNETSNPKFCSRSCSATYNNKLYPKRTKEEKEIIVKNTELITSKVCIKCKRELSLDMFYSGGNDFCCKDCLKIYRNTKRHSEKQKAVDYKGGRCQICGYDRSLRALQFHHLDPSKKDFTLSHHSHFIFENFKEEIDKCILICANCHAEIHDGLISL